MVDHQQSHRDPERERERERERYRELLEELRTILPGVQVLFAFLLTVPFAARFAELDDVGRGVFAGSILAAALTAVVFLSPAAYHRMAPNLDRADRVRVGVVMVVLGMTLLAVTIAAAVFVVVRFIFDSTGLGLTVAGVTAIAVVVAWGIVPRVSARGRRRED